MAKANVTLEQALKLLDYDPETGRLTWKPQPAGFVGRGGYIQLCFDGKCVSAHRLIWLMTSGQMPEGHIDHINGDPSDNRLSNLRDVTSRVNAQNQRRAKRNNKAKMLGVAWHEKNAKWQAQIKIDGKNKYLGTYETPEEAHSVYLDAKRRLHAGCTI